MNILLSILLSIFGVIIVVLLLFMRYVSNNYRGNFDVGATFGVIITLFMVVEVSMLAFILEKPSPTAMDVYRDKTTLEYKVVDGIKTDSVVIFKDSIYETRR